MGDKNIKKEAKKPKKSDKKVTATSVAYTPSVIPPQPEVIKKIKKPK